MKRSELFRRAYRSRDNWVSDGPLIIKHKKAEEDMTIQTPEDVAAVPAGAIRTESGLAYRVLSSGRRRTTVCNSEVEVHYSGWMTNGEHRFVGQSRQPNHLSSKPSDRNNWALQLMTVGEKTRFWIPGQLAYGENDTGTGRPYGTLVFDIELLSFKIPAPPEAPENLSSPPACDHDRIWSCPSP